MPVSLKPVRSIAIESLPVTPDYSAPPVIVFIRMSPSKLYSGVMVSLQERRLLYDLFVAQKSGTDQISSRSADIYGKVELVLQGASAFVELDAKR